MRRALSWIFLLGALGLAIWLLLSRAAPLVAPPARPAVSARALPPKARDAGRPILREIAPASLPGEPFTVELMDPPAKSYVAVAPASSDAANAALVAKLGRAGVIYDPALGRAARELAYQQSLLDGLVPQDIVDFLLRSSGAVDRTVLQSYTATSGDGSEAARQRLDDALASNGDPGPVRVGIGEVWIPGAKLPRIVGVLVSRRDADIDPAPRRIEIGETWELSGVLPRGHDAPSALVLRPTGELDEVPVTTVDRRFRVRVEAGNTRGTLMLAVGAEGPLGHTTLVQLPVEVGQAPPETYATRLPPDESKIRTPEAAEPLALSLLNADRARFGLPALVRDPKLDVIARAHSADMRDHGFFGHRSPTTGGPKDRIEAAGYRAVAFAENLAAEGSLHSAEANLLASLGHRRNILDAGVTHVGIGVAARERKGRMEWHLTQLFARPVVAIDAAAEADKVSAALAEGRRAAGLAAFARDPGLDRIARDHAARAAEGKLDGLARAVLDDAQRAGLTPGAARAWIQRTSDLSAFEPPAEANDAALTRVGIGIVQLRDDPQGATGVVLIFSSDRE